MEHLIDGEYCLSNNQLNKEDLIHLLQMLAAASFKGDALDRVYELKQKLLALLKAQEQE